MSALTPSEVLARAEASPERVTHAELFLALREALGGDTYAIQELRDRIDQDTASLQAAEDRIAYLESERTALSARLDQIRALCD